jgi:predicted benzoate:H+ symporter BenE
MIESIPVLLTIGVGLHLVVGAVAGRLIRFLVDTPLSKSAVVARIGGLAMMIGYSQAVGFLIKPLRSHDAALIFFAIILLVTTVISYRWRN